MEHLRSLRAICLLPADFRLLPGDDDLMGFHALRIINRNELSFLQNGGNYYGREREKRNDRSGKGQETEG